MPRRPFAASTVGIIACVLLCAGGVLYALTLVQAQVEQSVRRNFGAAGTLARIQVHGERLRRFEKEAFIYLNDSGRRQDYARQFDATARLLLADLDSALMPGGTGFDDADRALLGKWKEAAFFYFWEFERLVARAQRAETASGTATPTPMNIVEFNAAIGPGKNRFRELLDGADRMRAAKERASMRIADEIDLQVLQLTVAVLVASALGLVVALAGPLLAGWLRTLVLGRHARTLAGRPQP